MRKINQKGNKKIETELRKKGLPEKSSLASKCSKKLIGLADYTKSTDRLDYLLVELYQIGMKSVKLVREDIKGQTQKGLISLESCLLIYGGDVV